MKRFLAVALIAALPALASAQTIKPGHVMGNGTASERTPTDTSILTVLGRAGSFTGVASQWPWQLNTDGSWATRQPSFSDLAAGQISIETAFSGQAFFAPTGNNSATNWLKTYAYGDNNTSVVALNRSGGGVSIVGASRASDAASGTVAPIGLVGWGFTDGVGAKVGYPAWGGYFECRSYSGTTGYCTGIEIDSTNLRAATVDIDPYSPFASGSMSGLHIASGGNCTTASKCYDPVLGTTTGVARASSVGLLISSNEATFNKGLVFDARGITGADGTDTGGTGIAIALARGHALNWYVTGGGKFQVASVAKSSDPAAKLLYTGSNGLVMQDAAGTNLMQLYTGSGGNNGVALVAAATGSNPVVQPYSDANTNVSLTVRGKGTGLLNLVSPTFNSSTGYLYANGASAATFSTTIPTSALSGTVSNGQLANSSTTVNGQTCTLGSTCTVTSAAGTLTGSTLAAGVTASSLTSLGTLTSLTVGGTVTVNADAFNMTSANGYQPQMVFWNQHAGNDGGYYTVQKSRGASGAGSAVQVGDTLGTFLFRGADSNGTIQNGPHVTATVDAVAAGSITAHLLLSGNVTMDSGVAVGAPTGGYKGTGTINAASGYYANGTAGLSVTKTVRASGGAADCTLIYTSGILTGGSC